MWTLNFDETEKLRYITGKKKAEEQAAWIWKRNKISEDVTWEVIAVVEPKELKDTEAEWIVDFQKDLDPYCSNCKYSAQ